MNNLSETMTELFLNEYQRLEKLKYSQEYIDGYHDGIKYAVELIASLIKLQAKSKKLIKEEFNA